MIDRPNLLRGDCAGYEALFANAYCAIGLDQGSQYGNIGRRERPRGCRYAARPVSVAFRRRSKSRSPQLAVSRMRTARVVLSTVACASRSRQFQASSSAIFMRVIVAGSKCAVFVTDYLFTLECCQSVLREHDERLTKERNSMIS
jgi:hypothetical protein